MTTAADRRLRRRRAFIRAAGVAGAGMAAAAALGTAGAPLAGAGAAAAGAIGGMALLRAPAGVPIIVYHSVSPDAGWLPWADNTSVRPEVFRSHLAAIRRGGWTVIATRDLVTARRAGTPLPARCLVIHFDDGYLDNLLFAVPILREFRMPATIFVSTDFIEPGDVVRNTATATDPSDWRGYMTAAELRLLDADPLIDIECHGVDHARVAVSDTVDTVLDADNWRRHVPLAWSQQPGPKARWYEALTPPPPLGPGRTVPRTDSALAARRWQDGALEPEDVFAARVTATIERAGADLGTVLGRSPEVFAWPYDRSCPVAVEAAFRAGFAAVTGGNGTNSGTEDPRVLSRVHVQDHAFGGGPAWLETLALRARLNVVAGRLGWHLVTAIATRMRRVRFRAPGYAVAS